METKIYKFLVVLTLIVAIALVAQVVRMNPVQLPKAITIDTQGQPMLGNADAKVTIVAFEDLKCIDCKQYMETVFPKLKLRYIDTGKVNYVPIVLAFLEGSDTVGNSAYCLEAQNQAFFFPYVDSVYKALTDKNPDWAKLSQLLVLAGKIPGVNQTLLQQCIAQNTYADRLNKNFLEGKKAMHSGFGSPTLYVNGMVVKPLTYGKLFDMIDEELKKNNAGEK